jgi:glutathione S-transferase
VMISEDGGGTRSPEFKKINPKGRVPVLVDGNFLLTEAPAILLYLAQSTPRANLAPQGSDGLVRAVEWFNWLSGTVHAVAVRMIWRVEYFTAELGQTNGIKQKGSEHVSEAYAMIDARMRSQEWAVGDRYSVVDPYLLVFYRWGNRKLDMRGRYPAWTMHTRRLERRSAVQRALATEGISIWD